MERDISANALPRRVSEFNYPLGYSFESKIQYHHEAAVAEMARCDTLRERAARILIEAEAHEQMAATHALALQELMDGRSTAQNH